MRYLIFTYILVASLYAIGETSSGDPAIGTLGLGLGGTSATGTGLSGNTGGLGYVPTTDTSALGTGTNATGSAVNPYPYGTGTAAGSSVGVPGTAGLGGVTAYGGNQLTANDAASYDPTAGQILIDPNDPATYARICPSICARMGQANNPTCLANCVGSVVPGLQPLPSQAQDDQLLPLLLALVNNDPAPPPPPVDVFVQLPPIPEQQHGKHKH